MHASAGCFGQYFNGIDSSSGTWSAAAFAVSASLCLPVSYSFHCKDLASPWLNLFLGIVFLFIAIVNWIILVSLIVPVQSMEFSRPEYWSG